MVSRRDFLKATAGVGAGLFLPISAMRSARAQTVALLDPLTQPKFVNPLPNPLDPAYIYRSSGIDKKSGLPLFEVQMQEITHDTGLVDPATGRALATPMWGYGTPSQPAVYPGYSFQVRQGNAVKVRYSNQLTRSYPANVPVDSTLHWADPLNGGNVQGPYTGPVPLVTHQHGGDTDFLSDGLPDAWFTPGNAIKGRLFNPLYTYDNRQEATQLWYHDHPVGVTRLNVFMGLAGNYFIRDANEDALNLPKFPYEVSLLIQDRQFLADGNLFYPSVDDTNPTAPVPTHLPEFFGDTILVNGKAWPVLDVEPRKYRFRVLNGSDARFYDMFLSSGQPFIQIGSDLGLLNSPVPLPQLSVAPGERADIIIDFSGFQGQQIVLRNVAKAPNPSGDAPDPQTTGRIMAFRVSLPKSSIPDPRIPGNLRPISGPVPVLSPASAVTTRRILLFEGTDPFNRLQTMIGPVDPVGGLQGTLLWEQPITETPKLGTTEIWEFHNTTGDAHPIHMHLVDFRILSRQKFTGTLTPKTNPDGSIGAILDPASIQLLGRPKVPGAEERGKKDTAKMFPGEVTRVIANFKRPGEYVYHCHILSHEDHEMMRPYRVIP
jgi:spore coat protein A, manganese oxidase